MAISIHVPSSDIPSQTAYHAVQTYSFTDETGTPFSRSFIII
ncbi:hypothetical protein [Paraprevotella xylaniphila]|uniref:Uncharacterized protein n=1 Tax=Paraprevotella xylaniphila YIT 11841 TaxID=762982 RepID=F3QVB1_9BACT|nr:hypothetical protein [Paraprevotella xylaniphila]EGG52692.1 hypothetical protein HMPREF9442_02137 [Paraprevotella xylaniphila YIT 11841]